ncbi:hypothetical protein HHK36_006985 [Tetracentron sinense]|uniref:Uncharacterized protein n=1 Tax=Tetracentron sinense TaxID=13715 RepID=A0A835DL83_TETSI|nr:hypothetical protein HHK36_006985 [Tetracentron sinense]
MFLTYQRSAPAGEYQILLPSPHCRAILTQTARLFSHLAVLASCCHLVAQHPELFTQPSSLLSSNLWGCRNFPLWFG